MTLTIKAISGILSFVMMFSPIGFKKGEKQSGGIKTVTVASDGSGDYTTLDGARDYIRTLNKAKYDGIDVAVKAGDYHLDSEFALTKEDSGTENCPIRYVGEDGAVLEGAVKFTAKDFEPSSGDVTKWFKADAKANIVMVDLKNYGYSGTLVKELYDNPKTCDFVRKVPMLYCDGARLSLARYPNEGYVQTGAGSEIPGGEGAATDNVSPMYIYFGEEYADTVRSWHDINKVFVDARFSYTWCNENTRLVSVDEDKPMMTVLFSGGHDPHESTPFFWYNIPEELDAPGEYYIGEDSVLYLYKPENFDTCEITIPKTEYGVKIEADYVTLENVMLDSFFTLALNVNADHFTLKDCTIRGIVADGATISGSYNLIEGNEIYNIGDEALDVGGGDQSKLISSETVVRNNTIHDWGQVHEQYCYGLSLDGVGILATHNELYNSPHIAVYFSGSKNVFEYGYVHDVLLRSDDVGAFASSGHFGAFGNTVRYNYIKNVGPTDPAFKVADYGTGYPACGSNVFYWDFKGSGQQTYGNVIEHVYGDAYHSEGQFNTVTNSLIVGCAKYAFEVFDTSYREHLDQGGKLDGTFNAMPEEITDAWIREWPELGKLEWGGNDVVGEGNPNYAGAPHGIVVKDNAVYYDKGYTWKSTAMKNPFKFDKYAAQYSDLVDDGVIEYVNSKRDGYDIDELVKKHESLLGMTYEQFKSCGVQK